MAAGALFSNTLARWDLLSVAAIGDALVVLYFHSTGLGGLYPPGTNTRSSLKKKWLQILKTKTNENENRNTDVNMQWM